MLSFETVLLLKVSFFFNQVIIKIIFSTGNFDILFESLKTDLSSLLQHLRGADLCPLSISAELFHRHIINTKKKSFFFISEV